MAQAGCSSVKRTGRTNVEDEVGLDIPPALPVDPALFLFAGNIGASTHLAAAWPDGTPPFRMPSHDLNASTLDLSHFGSFFALRKRSKFRADKPATAASTGRRSGHSGTHLGATGGTQTHSRRTRPKLGRLHRARQGLVRVPESNTKYGGKSGKTGGPCRFLLAQVSVSPQGFPREKIVLTRPVPSFRPLFTGQVFIAGQGLPWGDSRGVTGRAGQACRLPDGSMPE